MPDAIWTIGHSTRPFFEFLECLKANRIHLVADVRRFPGSRRYPQYNQGELAQALNGAVLDLPL